MPRLASIAFFLLLAIVASPLWATDSYTLSNSSTQNITEWSTCKRVTNNHASGLSLFIPTKTNAEWTSFYTSPPPGVTVASCVTPGSQNYTTAGTYSFTVPAYTTLTVQVWGGGGGGGAGSGFRNARTGCMVGVNLDGGVGGQSSWNSTLFANGGNGGGGVTDRFGASAAAGAVRSPAPLLMRLDAVYAAILISAAMAGFRRPAPRARVHRCARQASR